ncbi:MAG: SPOR domain-containing protein [Rhodocyclaceae bacterium]
MSDSDNIDLQKRSRRRLVGAAALALLAAIVLPMVMDDEPGVPVHDIQVTIPDREADSAFARPIAGRPHSDEPALAAVPLEQLPPIDEIIDDDAIPLDDPAPVAVVPPSTQPTPPARVEPPPSSAVTQAPPAAAVDRPAPPSTPPSAPADDEAARVRAILEGQLASAPGSAPSAATPRSSASGSFVVQVGAFGEAAKASALSSDLNKRGFSSYTESAGPVTRVRVGPFGSRDEAERAAERLRALNMSAVVTAR